MTIEGRDVDALLGDLIDAGEDVGETATALLEALRPWETLGGRVNEICVKLTLRLAKLGIALTIATRDGGLRP